MAKKDENNFLFLKNAKISSKGQITIPLEIRRMLNVGEGDIVTFGINNEQEMIIKNRKNIKFSKN